RQRLQRENLTARLQPPSTVRPTVEVEMQGPLGTAAQTMPRVEWSLSAPPSGEPVLPFTNPLPPLSAPSAPPTPAQQAGPTGRPAADLESPPPKILQLYDPYLVVETDAGMLLIDQHALHERILFEQLKKRIRQGPLESQQLLIPEPVDLTADQAAR